MHRLLSSARHESSLSCRRTETRWLCECQASGLDGSHWVIHALAVAFRYRSVSYGGEVSCPTLIRKLCSPHFRESSFAGLHRDVDASCFCPSYSYIKIQICHYGEAAMRRSEIRDHLLETALRLFNQHGYHAAGIDLIIAEAGVAKTTLYRHFETKEDLILAALERRDEQDRDAMRAFVEQRASDPVERLLVTFDFLEALFRDERFRGCIFVSAAGEHKDTVNPVFRAAVMHKRL